MALEIKIRLNRKVIKSAQIRPKLLAAITRAALEAENAVKLGGKVPVNVGALKTSITKTIFANRLRAQVGSPLKYDIVMEQGRRAGKKMPPKAPIRQWILQKGIFDDAVKKQQKEGKILKKFKGRQIGALARKVRAGRKEKRRDVKRALNLLNSLTFVIRRSIKRDGIPPHGYYAAVAAKMKTRFRTILLEEMKR